MEIKIIPLGSDDKPLDSYGQDGQSFAETYAPIVELLLRESRLHAVVHTVPGGPAMAQAVCRLIEEARKRQKVCDYGIVGDVLCAVSSKRPGSGRGTVLRPCPST